MNIMCPEAVHPCGPAERAHEHYCYYYKHYCYYQYYTWIICVHDRSMHVRDTDAFGSNIIINE